MLTDLRTENVGVQTEISGLRWVGWTMNELNLFCFILSLTSECQVYVEYKKKKYTIGISTITINYKWLHLNMNCTQLMY